MLSHYSDIRKDIVKLLAFLKSLKIEAELMSHLENDFLIACEFLEKFSQGKHGELTENGRTAVGGLHELYKWIWSIKECDEFSVLVPHLQMLSESATRINAMTPMISPVTNKQDDKSNKLIETIVAMFAVKVGKNINLDDPVKSCGGDNPDILFDYEEQRIAIACKTLRGLSPQTFLDNFRSAAKQIDRAKCDCGYIAINAMNILPHHKVVNSVFLDLSEPILLITSPISDLYKSLRINDAVELSEIFVEPKVRPLVLTFVHSCTRLRTMAGNLSTMIKATFASPLLEGEGSAFDLKLLEQVNEFIHQRL